jgi:hypothetical protein
MVPGTVEDSVGRPPHPALPQNHKSSSFDHVTNHQQTLLQRIEEVPMTRIHKQQAL